jgi:hypothetical protein
VLTRYSGWYANRTRGIRRRALGADGERAPPVVFAEPVPLPLQRAPRKSAGARPSWCAGSSRSIRCAARGAGGDADPRLPDRAGGHRPDPHAPPHAGHAALAARARARSAQPHAAVPHGRGPCSGRNAPRGPASRTSRHRPGRLTGP